MNSVYRKSTINRIQSKFKLINYNKCTPVTFMNYRVILTIIVLFIFLFFSSKGYIYGPILAFVCYLSFEYFLDFKIKLRKEKLNYEAIFYFQILILTLESGKNLQDGIRLTCSYIDSEISDEFKKVLEEMKLGKSLVESLNDMKEHIPSEEVNTVILNIIQGTLLGNNVLDSLNNQIDYLKDKKMLEVKAKINKMPLKISVISVIFIIPIILLLILGPVIINYLLNI